MAGADRSLLVDAAPSAALDNTRRVHRQLRSLGFRLLGEAQPHCLSPTVSPTVCVSDTHLVPEDHYFADDAPRELAQLLEALASYRILILGDFIESLPLSRAALAELPRARRLRRVFQLLRACTTARVILGNHDARAREALYCALPGQVLEAELRDGAVRFFHGHARAAADVSHFAATLHGAAVPLGVTLRRLGLDLDLGPENTEIARCVPAGEYWCFGHTHEPSVTMRYANSGSFLRNGSKTLLTIESPFVRLWGTRSG